MIYATRNGYQKGAQIKAAQHNIELLIVREVESSDWYDDEGNPLLKEIHLISTLITYPVIQSIEWFVHKEWFEVQTELRLDDVRNEFGSKNNNIIFINDLHKNERYSLFELAEMLLKRKVDITYGSGEHSEFFENAFVENVESGVKVKIKKYKLFYRYSKPIKDHSVIDYGSQIIGIVESYTTGIKEWVSNNNQNH